MKSKDYNLDWGKYFVVDEESPSGLSWSAPRYYKGTPNYSRVGTPVGSILKGRNDYWVVGLGDLGGTYLIHRIKWVMMNGHVDEDKDVDHEDGDGLNNKSYNLRLVPKRINSRNKRVRVDNKTGINAVCYCETRTGSGYQAQFIDLTGKKKTKFYSELKYGTDGAKKLAEEWYNSQNLLGNGYTERHGK